MTTNSAPVITVDGPSGVGKGTLSALLARRLGWRLLDSGALYRLTALAANRCGVPVSEEGRMAEIAERLVAEFRVDATGAIKVYLDDIDVSDAIRREECGNAASKAAAIPAVRSALLGRQRDFRRWPGLVADGRDMGTVVFPDAEVKIFLTATATERARRRFEQLKQKGISASLDRLATEIAQRDKRDTERLVAPLCPAPDAEVVDTSALSIDEVEHCVLDIVSRRINRV
jgi:cytidylate kinase